MRAGPVIWCLWPGLTRLWLRGEWTALLTAISFAALFNSVLLLTFVWSSVLPTSMKIAAWVSLGGFWLASAAQTLKSLPRPTRRNEKSDDAGLFLQAQNEYLRQHWYEAESLLKRCLQIHHHDVDARLLLVSLLRRTQRTDAAREQLRQLAEIPEAIKWHMEIRREQRLLESAPTTQKP